MADILRNPAKYIAELYRKISFDPRCALADNQFSRQYNIYQFSIAPLITDSTNYWIAWGGTFDNPVGYNLQIYFNFFLVEVFTEANLIGTDNSFYIDQDNDLCYVHIDIKPWRYFAAYAAIYQGSTTTFSSGVKNENNPSDNKYGGINVIPRLLVPKLKNKISNAISGIVNYGSFNIRVNNNDGKFDSENILEFFNTPIQIRKSTDNAQIIPDFNRIRYGIIQDIEVDFDEMSIEAADPFFTMDKEFCKPFTVADYPNLPDDNIDELMPVAWGDVKKVPVFQVDKDTADPATWIDYIVLDPDYITGFSAIYDSDGNSLVNFFDYVSGIVRVEPGGGVEATEAECADVTGDTDNSIGQIVIAALQRNENIQYVDGIWDVTETEKYLALCAEVGFYFSDGTTRELIEDILKNDIAYLIQKNNGLWTLRQWGQTYEIHNIPSWAVTKTPAKNFKDASKNFCSSCRILYNKDYNEDEYTEKYLDDTQERSIFQEYKKSYTADFETDLIIESERSDLATRILERFGKLRETLKVSCGVDTFDINLLDTVKFEVNINDREFSEWSQWIVKECDPGQDKLTIEGLWKSYILTFDDVDASFDGDLAEVLEA